jgi:quinol monooxygenase YgiN
MHAVVIRVTVKDPEAAVRSLHEEVVPGTKQAQGFVAGYWTRKGDEGLAMVILESEEAAQQFRKQVDRPQDQVTIDDVEVREVVAHA